MKKTILLIMLMTINLIYSQMGTSTSKNQTYAASNNLTYKVGDTITLGKGSGMNGRFAYLQMGGFFNAMAAMGGNYNDVASGIDRNYSGKNVVIKKIKQEKDRRGTNKTYFVVAGGNLTNYNLMIEDAIESCEVKDCKRPTQNVNVVYADSKYDKLKKVKELLDSGILTEEEYKTEKEKIMAGN